MDGQEMVAGPHLSSVLDALTNVVAGRALPAGMRLGLFDVLGNEAKSHCHFVAKM